MRQAITELTRDSARVYRHASHAIEHGVKYLSGIRARRRRHRGHAGIIGGFIRNILRPQIAACLGAAPCIAGAAEDKVAQRRLAVEPALQHRVDTPQEHALIAGTGDTAAVQAAVSDYRHAPAIILGGHHYVKLRPFYAQARGEAEYPVISRCAWQSDGPRVRRAYLVHRREEVVHELKGDIRCPQVGMLAVDYQVVCSHSWTVLRCGNSICISKSAMVPSPLLLCCLE